MEEKLEFLPTNYIKRVEQIINEYNSTGRGLIHGFQKDAIQNAVGARATNSWKGWKCCIDLVESKKGWFLTVTDYGTEGLTGPNKTTKEIAEMCDRNDVFPQDWRLARISCNNVSGGNTTGAGLFGIGKILYSAASKSDVCKYYFESLTSGFGYRCNVNNKNKSQSSGAFEGEEAKNYIENETGLAPIIHIGTRIIICSPKDEIIEAINNGEMMRNIEETWWRIFPYLSAEDSGIFLNGTKAEIPSQYEKSNCVDNQYYEDETSILVYPELNLRTKKVGFFICKDLDEDLQGFYFYRKGMKVGQINLSDILPKPISSKYYGYVELQPSWENELVPLENITHYDVQGTKKANKVYAELRHYIINLVNEKLREWGYIKEKESQDKILHSLLLEIQDDIQTLFKDEGFENLGKGDLRSQYSIRLRDIVFPNPDERKTVYTNDYISFGYNVRSNYSTNRKFVASIKILSPNGFENIIATESFEIDAFGTFKSDLVRIKIDETTAEKYSDNAVIISVIPVSGSAIGAKKIIFYYNIETRKNPEKDFDLVMSNREMPRINDKRINSDESINRVIYTFSNNLEVPTKLRLVVRTHNLENGARLICRVYEKDFELKPYESVDSNSFDICFTSSIYENELKRGKVEIRARLIVNGDNGIYEKGEEVAKYDFTVFFNMNEKKGIQDSFSIHPVDESENPQRAWSEGHTGDWKLYINIGHPEYIVSPDDLRRVYLEKLVIQEFVILYIKEGKYDQIGFPDDPDGSRASHIDVLVNLHKKIDEIWWKKCQR